MRFKMLFGVISACAVTISTASFAADYVSQKGSWIMNKGESQIPPGFTPPTNPMVVSDDNGQVLKFIVYDLNPVTGMQPAIPYEGAYDGKFYPYGKDAERSFTHVSTNSFRTVAESPEGWSQVELVTFGSGNTKMRGEGKYTGKDGKTVYYVQVWDRLQ